MGTLKQFRNLAIVLLLLAAPAFGQILYPWGSAATSIDRAVTTTTGTAFNLHTGGTQQTVPDRFSWSVTFLTAAPGGQTTLLEGSMDNVNWFTLDTSQSLAYVSNTDCGELRHVTSKPVFYIRCRISAFVVGGNTGTSCKITATVQGR